jgi:hypothetical protein
MQPHIASLRGRRWAQASMRPAENVETGGLAKASYWRLIATNQRRTIATAMSDAAIIRMTSNCNSNDPVISNSVQDWSAFG